MVVFEGTSPQWTESPFRQHAKFNALVSSYYQACVVRRSVEKAAHVPRILGNLQEDSFRGLIPQTSRLAPKQLNFLPEAHIGTVICHFKSFDWLLDAF